jgi:hypothetical protein
MVGSLAGELLDMRVIALARCESELESGELLQITLLH